jgi:hypothetical protein
MSSLNLAANQCSISTSIIERGAYLRPQGVVELLCILGLRGPPLSHTSDECVTVLLNPRL